MVWQESDLNGAESQKRKQASVQADIRDFIANVVSFCSYLTWKRERAKEREKFISDFAFF